MPDINREIVSRPLEFELNSGHPLYTSLEYAGLGREAKHKTYIDSSPYKRHGLMPYTSVSYWSRALGRPGWRIGYLGGYPIQVGQSIPQLGAGDFSAFIWFSIYSWQRVIGNKYTPLLSIGNNAGSAPAKGWTLYGDFASNKKLTFLDHTYSSIFVGSTTLTTTTEALDLATYPYTRYYHLGVVRKSGIITLYVDGKAETGTSANAHDLSVLQSDFLPVFCIGENSRYAISANGTALDTLLFSRALAPDTIARLADPSNVMLDTDNGITLIAPTWRRVGLGSSFLAGSSASLALAGTAATQAVGFNATSGNLALTGTDATLKVGFSVASGALHITGAAAAQAVGFNVSSHNLPLTGTAAAQKVVFNVDSGTLPIIGTAATMLANTPLAGASVNLALTGGVAAIDMTFVASSAPIVVTGGVAGMGLGAQFVGSPAFMALAGSVAVLDTTLAAASSALHVTGTAANMLSDTPLLGTGGTLTIHGTAATLLANTPLAGSSGSLAISGTVATLATATPLIGSSGTLTVGVTAATLSTTMNVDSGTLAMHGTAATLLANTPLLGSNGSLALNGTSATMSANTPLAGSNTALAVRGSSAGSGVTFVGTNASLPLSGAIATAGVNFTVTGGALHLSGTSAAMLVDTPLLGVSSALTLVDIVGSELQTNSGLDGESVDMRLDGWPAAGMNAKFIVTSVTLSAIGDVAGMGLGTQFVGTKVIMPVTGSAATLKIAFSSSSSAIGLIGGQATFGFGIEGESCELVTAGHSASFGISLIAASTNLTLTGATASFSVSASSSNIVLYYYYLLLGA